MVSSPKIVSFLVESPFSERDYKRFGIDLLRSNNIKIYIFDCTRIFASHYDVIYGDQLRLKGLENLYAPHSIWAVFQLLIKKKVDYAFDFVVPEYRRSNYIKRLILLIITSIICKRCVFNIGVFPSVYNVKGSKSAIYLFLSYLLSLPWKIFKPTIEFRAGLKGLISNSKRMVYCHNLDYDDFLSVRSEPKSKGSPYAIYLDQNAIFSTDRIYHGYNHIYSKNEFAAEVNSSLGSLANNTSLEMLVKLHPRSNIENYNDLYNLNIAEDSTALLIRDCDLVICHDTTAIQLAILSRKPIILWKMNSFVKHEGDPFTKERLDSMEYLSEILGIPLLTTHQIKSVSRIPCVDEKKYSSYIENYVKTSSSLNDFYWNIVSREL